MIGSPKDLAVAWMMNKFKYRDDTPSMRKVYNGMKLELKMSPEDWPVIEILAEIKGVGNLITRSSGHSWDEKSVEDFIQVYHLAPSLYYSTCKDVNLTALQHGDTQITSNFFTMLKNEGKFDSDVIKQLEESLKKIGWKAEISLKGPLLMYTHKWLLLNGKKA